MDHNEEQEEMLREMIACGDDITSQYLNDSSEGVEDLELRDGSDEGMEGENAIIKSSEVYKLSRCWLDALVALCIYILTIFLL